MSLVNFCSWQKTLNERGSTHHDIAVLITRKSICETTSNNCGVLGEWPSCFPHTQEWEVNKFIIMLLVRGKIFLRETEGGIKRSDYAYCGVMSIFAFLGLPLHVHHVMM